MIQNPLTSRAPTTTMRSAAADAMDEHLNGLLAGRAGLPGA